MQRLTLHEQLDCTWEIFSEGMEPGSCYEKLVPSGCFFILSAFCVISLWSAHAVFVLNDVTVYAENGLIENLQVVVLAICVFVYLGPFAMEKEREKLIILSCSWLCVSFLLREVDVERLNVHEALIFIGSGVGRNTMLTLGFLALSTYAAARFSYYKKAALEF